MLRPMTSVSRKLVDDDPVDVGQLIAFGVDLPVVGVALVDHLRLVALNRQERPDGGAIAEVAGPVEVLLGGALGVTRGDRTGQVLGHHEPGDEGLDEAEHGLPVGGQLGGGVIDLGDLDDFALDPPGTIVAEHLVLVDPDVGVDDVVDVERVTVRPAGTLTGVDGQLGAVLGVLPARDQAGLDAAADGLLPSQHVAADHLVDPFEAPCGTVPVEHVGGEPVDGHVDGAAVAADLGAAPGCPGGVIPLEDPGVARQPLRDGRQGAGRHHLGQHRRLLILGYRQRAEQHGDEEGYG